MRNNCYLFETLFKTQKNGVFVFGISGFFRFVDVVKNLSNSGKLRHGSEVTFLENEGGWCTFLRFVHNDINSWAGLFESRLTLTQS